MRFIAKCKAMDANYHLYVMEMAKAYAALSDRVKELEEQIARLQGKKKKCVIIEMKPKINKL